MKELAIIAGVLLTLVTPMPWLQSRAASGDTGPSAAGDKMAVVVGIGAYPTITGVPRLKYARADAEALAALLRRQGYKVRLLVDGEALRRGIVRAIEEAGKALEGKDGTLLLYFSGHGFADRSTRVNYLVPFDADLEDLASTAISFPLMVELMNASGAKRKVVVIDACRNTDVSWRKGLVEQGFADFRGGEGLRVLFATGFGDVSYEDDELGHGVFTYFLLQGLEGAAAGEDGVITFRELADYTARTVKAWAFARSRDQRPFDTGEASGRFVLGHRLGQRAGGAVAAPRPAGPVGNLQIRTRPAGARCYLDGADVGVSPRLLADVPVGDHHVRCVVEGYAPFEGRVTIAEGELRPLDATLEPLPGELEVVGTPRGARVVVDGKEVGTTPWKGRVKPGRHVVRVEKEGFWPTEEAVVVAPGKQGRVDTSLGPYLPTAIVIETTPPGAEVVLDGTPRGTSPVSLDDILEGEHEVLLRKDGYLPREERIIVRQGAATSFSLELRRATGTLRVAVSPDDAEIVLQGPGWKRTGTGEVEWDLPPGTYQLVVDAVGFKRSRQKVTIAAGEERRVEVELEERTPFGETFVGRVLREAGRSLAEGLAQTAPPAAGAGVAPGAVPRGAPAADPGMLSAGRPWARINSVFLEQNVPTAMGNAVTVHVNLEAHGLQNVILRVRAMFGIGVHPLQDFDGMFSCAGWVCSEARIVPDGRDAVAPDIQLTLPYNQLHLARGQFEVGTVVSIEIEATGDNLANVAVDPFVVTIQ